MKTFHQFMEQSKLNLDKRFTNTTDAVKNVFTGKDATQIQNDLKSGKLNIDQLKNFANSKELGRGIENVVQSFGKDASMSLNKLFNKLQDFKIPKK